MQEAQKLERTGWNRGGSRLIDSISRRITVRSAIRVSHESLFLALEECSFRATCTYMAHTRASNTWFNYFLTPPLYHGSGPVASRFAKPSHRDRALHPRQMLVRVIGTLQKILQHRGKNLFQPAARKIEYFRETSGISVFRNRER